MQGFSYRKVVITFRNIGKRAAVSFSFYYNHISSVPCLKKFWRCAVQICPTGGRTTGNNFDLIFYPFFSQKLAHLWIREQPLNILHGCVVVRFNRFAYKSDFMPFFQKPFYER